MCAEPPSEQGGHSREDPWESDDSVETREIGRRDLTICRLDLRGRMDAGAFPLLLDEIQKARENKRRWFLLDMEKVTFIGSAAVGIILSLIEDVRSEGGDVVLVAVPASAHQVFDSLNILEFLEIRRTDEEAIEHLLSVKERPAGG